jgi:hypothetical protein
MKETEIALIQEVIKLKKKISLLEDKQAALHVEVRGLQDFQKKLEHYLGKDLENIL